ncbi:MAG: hypothetical protein ACN4G0_06370, partial [Polyangiales bacterium]
LLFGVLGFAAETFLWPGGQVARADRLWAHQVSFLREQKLIDEDEIPSYFHSSGAFDIRSDGFGVTKDGFFSYAAKPSGDVVTSRHEFADIRDMTVDPPKSFFDDTIVTIDPRNGDRIQLSVVHDEVDADHKAFVGALMRRWREAESKTSSTPMESRVP